ncbi:hypothetical protein MaudCBS49596_001347 [Microsporum audouinii]
MAAIFREAPVGQVCRLIFGPQAAPYPDETKGFVWPQGTATVLQDQGRPSSDPEKAATESQSSLQSDSDSGLVDWSGSDDPDNPQNWSTSKKTFTFFQICLLTFTVYGGSSIITPAEPTFVERYGASSQASSLVLSMYVLGYGIGPLFFSPLSEIPMLGRNIPYMTSLLLYIIITIPASLVSSYPALVALRFIQGFLGGPVLATGGASAADILGFHKIPYGLTFWTCAAYGGPALSPLLSAFAVTGSTWRWSMYELLILGGFTFILLFFCLPETNPETILLRRARRLRNVTKNPKLRSQSEIKQGDIKLLALMGRYLTTPFKVTVQDPSVAFINIYTALIYSIYVSTP